MSKRVEFNRWELGIDLRKGESASDANRLLAAVNCYISHGMALKKRPGTRKHAELPAGTAGLAAGQGYLNVFYSADTEITLDIEGFVAHRLTRQDGTNPAIKHIHYADMFQAAFYVVAEYVDGSVFHHYLDGAEERGCTQITDENCPHTKAVTKAASKIFAVSPDGESVRFSSTGFPANWSEDMDAGFLSTGLNSTGDRVALSLGVFENSLAVLMRDTTQIWTVDPDPEAMKLDTTINNVGSSFPQSLATVSNDMFFLSDYGFRSIRTQAYVDKREDVDVGSPIDDIVRPIVKTTTNPLIATYYYGTGQYLCFEGTNVFVYTASKSSKISAWTTYKLPFSVNDIAEYGRHLYLRSGDNIYVLDEDVYTDDGQIFEVYAQMPFMDFKAGGINKHVEAIDAAGVGRFDLIVRPDATYPEFTTTAYDIVLPNTASGGRIPMPCNGTEFSFAFYNKTAEDWRLDRIIAYFNQDESV